MTKLCNICRAKILDSTFHRTGGLCKPCWKDQRRKKIGETPFGIAYDTYFHQPRRLTEKYFDCWIELELTIAGPLFSARCGGDVSFVFQQSAIDGVKDFDDLMAWMNGQIARFRDRVRNTEASTPAEASNRDVLLTRAAELEALIGLWPEFEKEFGRGVS
jgi:hypothetical protein